jgi:hypothetical protein
MNAWARISAATACFRVCRSSAAISTRSTVPEGRMRSTPCEPQNFGSSEVPSSPATDSAGRPLTMITRDRAWRMMPSSRYGSCTYGRSRRSVKGASVPS